MTELESILHVWRDSGDAVLATVVHVTGSAYRRPGARMLIAPGGRRTGSVSGGCLEGEIARKAWWFTESGSPVVRVYDTTADDDAVWEFGLGCNGVVHVMLERAASPGTREMLGFLEACRRRGDGAVVATLIHGAGVGNRLLVDAEGIRGGSLAGTALADPLLDHARAAMRDRASVLARVGGAEVFVEWIGPPVSLVVFGAGHDAVPLVEFASSLGWRITVVDGRPAYARADRFPGASRVMLGHPGEPLRGVPLDAASAVVLMTHNYPLDLRLLPRILAETPRYLGLLGPKARAARLFAALGIEQPAYVHAPVGLDVGGDAPAAVALSIVAEIQASLNERSGKNLRDRQGAIHPPARESGLAEALLKLETVRPAFCEHA